MARPTKDPQAGIQPYNYLSDAEREAIAEQVALCGNLAEAARRVVGERRVSAVHAAARNDVLGFGATVAAAEQRHIQSIRDEIKRRAFGFEKAIVYKGEITGTITEVSDVLLLSYARLFDPLFVDKRTSGDLHIVGDITVTDQPGVWSITDAESMALPPELKTQLANVLKYLIRHRREASRDQRNFEAAALTDQRAVDADFTEVPADDPYSLADLDELL